MRGFDPEGFRPRGFCPRGVLFYTRFDTSLITIFHSGIQLDVPHTHRVYLVDALASLVTFAAHPVPVEVGTHSVEDLA